MVPFFEVLAEKRYACPHVLVTQMVAEILLVYQTAMV
jgi:hypothetical protein